MPLWETGTGGVTVQYETTEAESAERVGVPIPGQWMIKLEILVEAGLATRDGDNALSEHGNVLGPMDGQVNIVDKVVLKSILPNIKITRRVNRVQKCQDFFDTIVDWRHRICCDEVSHVV